MPVLARFMSSPSKLPHHDKIKFAQSSSLQLVESLAHRVLHVVFDPGPRLDPHGNRRSGDENPVHPRLCHFADLPTPVQPIFSLGTARRSLGCVDIIRHASGIFAAAGSLPALPLPSSTLFFNKKGLTPLLKKLCHRHVGLELPGTPTVLTFLLSRGRLPLRPR